MNYYLLVFWIGENSFERLVKADSFEQAEKAVLKFNPTATNIRDVTIYQ